MHTYVCMFIYIYAYNIYICMYAYLYSLKKDKANENYFTILHFFFKFSYFG